MPDTYWAESPLGPREPEVVSAEGEVAAASKEKHVFADAVLKLEGSWDGWEHYK